MLQRVSEATVLVPVDVSDPGALSSGLIELLSPHAVVILGYYPVPDQSASEQLRSQFGEEAEAELSEIEAQFSAAGADTESILVFTKDRSKTIDRVAAEQGVDAVLTAESVGDTLDSILVPLRGDENLDEILDFVSTLVAESDAKVTIFNVAESEDDASRGELIIRGASDRLEETGIDPRRIDWRQVESGSASDAIIAEAEAFDLLVVGEAKPSLRERLLGQVTNEVIEGSPRPVLIVRSAHTD